MKDNEIRDVQISLNNIKSEYDSQIDYMHSQNIFLKNKLTETGQAYEEKQMNEIKKLKNVIKENENTIKNLKKELRNMENIKKDYFQLVEKNNF
jgi:gas vesicle protein